jgi:hypothetical protein
VSGAETFPADTLDNVLVHDPIYKAGQDPAGGISAGLALRSNKGPKLDYYGSLLVPTVLGAAASGEAIYCDTLDVTDADWLDAHVALFFNEDAGDVTTACNAAVGLEASMDGIYWFPIGVINRAAPIAPATMFRDDDGQTVGLPSATGGFADATTTQNAPMLEDMVPMLPAVASAVADPFVVQRDFSFYVGNRMYVRLVVVAIYSEAVGTLPPSLGITVMKSAS